jgi:TolA-binding protein
VDEGVNRNVRSGTWLGARAGLLLVVITVALLGSGCVYFNTFYHARKSFNEGEKVREQVGGRGAGVGAGKTHYENAIAKASKIVEKHPGSKYHDDALFMIGMCYFRMGNYTKSENAFRELLATHPKSNLVEETRLYLARCRIELGDERAGFHEFTELAKTARKSEWRAEAIYQRGSFFYNNEIYDSAATEFMRVVDDYPKSDRAIDARLSAARAMRKLERYDEAIRLYQPLAKDEDEKKSDLRLEALRGIGNTYYESDRPDSGIAVFSAMAENELFEDSIGPIRLALAHGLQEIGDYDEAWRQYERVVAALERTVFSAEAYFRMAEIKQFVEEDLVAAKDLYDQSRLESAAGDIAKEALTRSANISKLEQFRVDLGRGELKRQSDLASEGPYEPEMLPRLEREITYSPPQARPPNFGAPAVPLDPTLDVHGPPTPAEGEALAEGDAAADEAVLAEDVHGPPTALAPFHGPPTDSAVIAENLKRRILLRESDWWSLLGVDSVFGPPSPGYLYAFGEDNLYGPPTPDDSVLFRWAMVGVDTAAQRLRAEREAAVAEHKAKMETISASATTQFQLAELYRFSLENPDSAVVEYDNMVTRYPNSPFAPKALLGAADVLTDDLADTAEAEKRLLRILDRYPYSDYAGEAIKRLGLRGTDADTAYPGVMYRKIEDKYILGGDPKRAIGELEQFIITYPDSRLVPHAEFAIVALTDEYFPTDDSSVVLAYEEIENNYPQTIFADAAAQKLTFNLVRPQRRQRMVQPTEEELAQAGQEGEGNADSAQAWSKLPMAPRPDSAGDFIFPETEVGVYERQMTLVYKIWIDFAGQITEVQPLQETESMDINENALVAVRGTRFNPDSIPPDSLNMYYRYELTVTPPAREYDDYDRLGIDRFNDPNRNR